MIRKELSDLAIAIDSIRPHPENVRQGDVGAITESLKLHGQYRPIVVQKSTGHILAGNHTYKAAKALKWKQIAATFVDCDDDQATRILLMDNRANDLASYDDGALAEMLKQLMDTDQQLAGTGFDPDDLQQLLDDLGADELPTVLSDPDDVPETAPAKTVPGDVWLLGPHRLMCGDSGEPTNITKLTNGATIDLLLTDPPYGINANKMTLGAGKKDFHRGDSWDSEKPNVQTVIGLANQHIVWGGNYFADQLPVSNDWLCWHKMNDGRSFSEFELAWTDLAKQCRMISHHWSGETKLHPTMKPVAVMEWCIIQADNPRTILDVYAGSGSTLIAAHQTNRTAYLMELDPHYCDVICARYQKLTGEKPVAESTGNEHDFLTE